MVRKMAIVLALASAALVTDATGADDIMSSQFYGSGVHRYFAGDLFAAHADFTSAIQGGTDDPRPYYFRALAYQRMGRQPEALADFAKGADLESADINGAYQVSKSLERVQGRSRLQLESLSRTGTCLGSTATRSTASPARRRRPPRRNRSRTASKRHSTGALAAPGRCSTSGGPV